MKTRFLLSLSLLISAITGAPSAQASTNAVSLELLGRGVLMGIQYDRLFHENWRLGAGLGRIGYFRDDPQGETDNASTLVPLYASYYFYPAWFATAGATVIFLNEETSGLRTILGGFRTGSLPLLATAGVGYEAREEATGFLFRLTGYFFAGKNLRPWIGVTFGYEF